MNKASTDLVQHMSQSQSEDGAIAFVMTFGVILGYFPLETLQGCLIFGKSLGG